MEPFSLPVGVMEVAIVTNGDYFVVEVILAEGERG